MDIDFALVGRRIREARQFRKMTSEALAEKIGFATESLRHIEGGSSKPSLQALYRIATELNVSMDYLTGLSSSIDDAVLQSAGVSLTPVQEKMFQDLIKSMLPIITDYV